jgi:phosphoribosylglycinamide formyltransferase-1
MRRLGILLSGRGSNFDAIARRIASGQLDADIALVLSNKPDAAGLETARFYGLPTAGVPSKGLPREAYDAQVLAQLRQHDVELVVLAGFMRLLTPVLVNAYRGRILNIHPSLLPAFPGLDAQKQALEHGVKYTGCTVHFVDEGLDSGPIIRQAVVPVHDGDSVGSLSARILEQEHVIYSEAIGLVLSGRYRLEGRRVVEV